MCTKIEGLLKVTTFQIFPDALYRRIVELFERQRPDKQDDQEYFVSALSDTVPVQEKILNWFSEEEPDNSLLEEATVASPDEPKLTNDGGRSRIDRYRELVTRTSAYCWLLAAMRRELTLINQEGDILDNIHKEISRTLPVASKFSIQRQPDAVTLLFMLDWDPAAFILKQEYSEDPTMAMERAITLTGSLTDAQALSCIQYMRQTWPSNGEYTLRLMQKLMDSKYGELIQGIVRCPQ